MQLRIRHTTRYSFSEPVAYGLQQLRVTPKDGHNQKIVTWSSRVENGKSEATFEDHHHNTVELISFERDVTEVEVICEGVVTVENTTGVIGQHPGPAPLWLYERDTKLTKVGPGVRGILRGVEGDGDLAKLHNLMDAIAEAVPYTKGEDHPDWSAEDAVREGKGVCQDHTHIFLACARAMGFPARYVSGYLMMADKIDQDASHAWAEAHVDGLGWVGFDTSNQQSPDDRYVRVATGLDYSEAAPVNGSRIGGSEEALQVQIQVAQQ